MSSDDEGQQNDELTGLLASVADKIVDDVAEDERKSRLNPYSWHNAAIMSSYFCVGFGMTFIGTPLTYYMIDTLYSSAEEQNVVSVVMSLPWSFKLLYGFLSDAVPIRGQRRKPYFCIGWAVYVAANALLAALVTPSVGWIAALMLVQTMGYMCSDVMTDTLVVERSKAFETEVERGSLQAAGYTLRTAGTCLGSVLGAVLYNTSSWGWGLTISQIFVLNATLPVLLLAPLVPSLVDDPSGAAPPPIADQWRGIFALVQRRAVWQPCAFIFMCVAC